MNIYLYIFVYTNMSGLPRKLSDVVFGGDPKYKTRKAKIQKYKNTKYKNTKIQKYKNAKIQKYKNTLNKKFRKIQKKTKKYKNIQKGGTDPFVIGVPATFGPLCLSLLCGGVNECSKQYDENLQNVFRNIMSADVRLQQIFEATVPIHPIHPILLAKNLHVVVIYDTTTGPPILNFHSLSTDPNAIIIENFIIFRAILSQNENARNPNPYKLEMIALNGCLDTMTYNIFGRFSRCSSTVTQTYYFDDTTPRIKIYCKYSDIQDIFKLRNEMQQLFKDDIQTEIGEWLGPENVFTDFVPPTQFNILTDQARRIQNEAPEVQTMER